MSGGTEMDCHDARRDLLDYARGRLPAERRRDVATHLEGCATCAHEELGERALTDALEQRLPQHPASLAVKRRLAASWPAAPLPARATRGRWRRAFVPALAVAAVLIATLPALYRMRAGDPTSAMADEAVNDHLRVLANARPLEIESGGIHQVKPWFAGRLDFAPVVSFGGDEQFPLKGGAVGYFFDRKAAVLVYSRRLHSISLFVFRADGLPWPAVDAAPTQSTRVRGFNVILWRAGELGYALVSDLDGRELADLAARVAG